jgi:hypothetical protein
MENRGEEEMKFDGKEFRFIGTFTKSDAQKMANKMRDPGHTFVRIRKNKKYGTYDVYARMK